MQGAMAGYATGARRWTSLIVIAAVLAALVPTIDRPAPAAAASTIKLPFASGATWYVSQGYNTSPAEGWSHYNCDPNTLKDAISQTTSCNAPYQYKYSFDLKRLDGNTTGQPVLSPVNGTIRWIDESTGGMSIDLGNGYAVAYFHTTLAAGLAAGQAIQQGQVLGSVAPAGEANNGGTAHIHLTLWQTNDGGNWSRNAIPFTDTLKLDGYDFPALGDSTRNQHYETQIVSTNQPLTTGSAAVPSTPTLVSPATGTTYTSTNVAPTLKWNAVSGATQYQVVINDGAITSSWVSTTQWTTPALGAGQYSWQVRARNSSGTGNLSAKWVFWVDPPSGSTPTPTTTPTGTPGTLALSLDRTSANYGSAVAASGSGFGPSETVNLYLDSTSSSVIATATTSSAGNFSVTFAMPDTANGNHTVIARGVTSKKQATKTLKMNATLARDPYQGVPGTSIVVTVHGFGANETVDLWFDSSSGLKLGTVTTGAAGTGSVTITMPQATAGWHDYLGTGRTSGVTAYGALYVLRQVKLSPTSGVAGDSVTVTARGFDGSTSVKVAWNKTATVAGTQVCSGTTTATGNYSCTFTVPQTVAGGYPVAVTEADGSAASATFVVNGPAGIATNPGSGAVMTNFIVNGGGFSPNESIALSWDSAATWVTVRTDGTGSFAWHATVPQLSVATHTLKAKGASSGKSASVSFKVTASGGDTGTSMIAPGTYVVTATVEGLVGGTTSNGHTITPYDRFVSLPACTETSCPYAVGGSRYYARCGDLCYVKVTNPANNKCSVAPVYDVGPWFTNDNWWDPADQRNLNNLGTTVNRLAQGYVGTDAAKNGLDVGYGISNGIGISNVGYEVGNRAAIDIADGTWVDIGFQLADGIHTGVIVEMLWQTGQSYASAAAACGQTTSPSITLSPTSGVAGTTVSVTGKGYQAGETVNIYVDSSTTKPIGSVTASSSGGFTKSVTIPVGTSIGDHRIHAVGQTSKLRTARTFTVTAPVLTLALAPKSAQIGATVQATGGGFQPGETVKIYLDSSKTTALTSVTASGTGGFTAAFTIPPTTGGPHRIHAVGQTSKTRTAQTLVVTPTLTPSIASGQARATFSVAVKGFAASETISLYWDNQSSPETTATVDASGVATFSTKAPWTYGPHTATVKGGTSNLQGTFAFSVTPKVKLTPNSGPASTAFQVRGTGFQPGTKVNVYWGSSSSGTLLCSKTTSSTYGTFTCDVTAPANASAGTVNVLATGGGLSASAAFTVTAAVAQQAALDEPAATPTPETAPAGDTPAPTATPDTGATPTTAPTDAPTEGATAPATEVPTEAPTATPTPEPVARELVFTAVADTSVSRAEPDAPQPPEEAGTLAAGDGNLAVLTFDVEGLGAGTVVQATLVVTGAGAAGGPGGQLGVLRDFWPDETALTYAGLPRDQLVAAEDANGNRVVVDRIDPGVEAAIDVTGTVRADGTVTFVLLGETASVVAIAARESGAPARLVVEVLDQTG